MPARVPRRRGPLILAHRGYSARFPENTALAFAEAVRAGADGIECDVQKSRDGYYVILHDDSVDRTSQGKGKVAAFSLRELRSFDFGRGERILELGELLDRIPRERWINVEVKKETISPEDCQRIAEMIRGRGRTERLLVSSFDHELLPVFARAGIETGALIGEEHGERGIRGLVAVVLRARTTYVNMPIQAFERAPAWAIRLLMRLFQLTGRRIIFWTVNRADQYARVADLCRFVITDEVEAALGWAGRAPAAKALSDRAAGSAADPRSAR